MRERDKWDSFVDDMLWKLRKQRQAEMDELCARVLGTPESLLTEGEHVAAYGIPGGYWYCTSCGKPQLGEVMKISGYEVHRCVACGPGEGFAPCPAAHDGARCVLCGGSGWVEELV